jgi:peptidoglycan pentaglycine glycine transferase (the first glycine)
MTELTRSQWDAFTSQYLDIHFLQSAAWGELKRDFGWSVARIQTGAIGAQVLFRSIFPGLTMAYIPKGPIGLSDPARVNWGEFLNEVDRLSKKKHAFFLKIEPDAWDTHPNEATTPSPRNFPPEPFIGREVPLGFQLSTHSVQPPRTILIDLSCTEEIILSRMKQKTRYNIRLAQRSEITVSSSTDLELFSTMMNETGERDQFGVHSPLYYQTFFDLFQPRGECELLLATFQDEPLAMLIVMRHGRRAWYLYGASRSIHREKMPTYLLQWEAIRWAKSHHCLSYDLWGVPDEEESVLEANFSSRSSGLWGVYRFKRGFGGDLFRSAGPWDRVYNPLLFRAYQYWTNRSALREPK